MIDIFEKYFSNVIVPFFVKGGIRSDHVDRRFFALGLAMLERIQWRCLVPTTSSQGPSVALHAKPSYDSSHSGTTIDAQGAASWLVLATPRNTASDEL
ncbi:hypothetical protein H5410_041639 [Solanum commersonii]|uniref:Uncharacterized protein n=1 Tax=Solanum commersonii TaxID=4109 RepID=A0A9J5XTG3_SOLCO|nr:hypothetical protein H5410_041639 [Solanum commersonii]